MKPEIEQQIEQMAGMSITGPAGKRKLEFSEKMTLQSMTALVGLLRQGQATLSIYDAFYPGFTEPGASFDYAQTQAEPDLWSMTMGGHGWTGGIYQIDDVTIAMQVFHLFKKGVRTSLSFETGGLVGGKSPQDADKNAEMVQRIRSLHPAS